MSKIYAAINNVMAEVGAVGKSKKNSHQGFMYRGVDDVMNALQPAFVKHKIFCVPEIVDQIREERQTQKGGNSTCAVCTIKYTFYAEDGSSVSATVIGEANDTSDKATNKAMSVAFKYACFQVFCIATEEMIDPDAETPETSQKVDKPKTITKAQISTVFKLSGEDKDICNLVLKKFGYSSSADVLEKDYKAICEEVRGLANAENSD